MNTRPRRILIVDDEESICEVTKLLVEMAGHTAVCVHDGQSALRELDAGGYEVMIVDMLMPEMDGVELINALRRRSFPVRLIAMSGGGHIPKESYLKIAQMSGAHALLPKPFTRDQLVRALEEALAGT